MPRSGVPFESSRRRPPYLLFLAMVLSLFAGSGAAWSQGAPLGNGVYVTITQLHWMSDTPGVIAIPYSRVGAAEFSFDSSAASLLTSPGGGFLNLYTSLNGASYQWSVQNLYVQYDNISDLLQDRPSVQIDLGNTSGTAVPMIHLQGTVTPVAVPPGPQPPPQQLAVMVVGASEYHVGGSAGGGSGSSSVPAVVGPWQGGNAVPVDRARTRVPPARLPAVSEDWMGCAPGGVARSIAYMADLSRVKRPPVQDIYRDLYRDMGTDGDGTPVWDIVAGKQAYSNRHRLGITTDLYEWSIGTVMNALDNGGDVEIFIEWWGGGGHLAMITSIVEMSDGSYQITYIDDPRQGDGTAANRTHVIYVDPATGWFGWGWVSGFLVEHIFQP